MNIRFFAMRSTTKVNRKGKEVEVMERVEVPVWQTPTEVTYKIARSSNPPLEYIKWVEENWPREPDEEGYCPTTYHLDEFMTYKRMSELNGFNLEAEII